jgi:hypothetical protein
MISHLVKIWRKRPKNALSCRSQETRTHFPEAQAEHDELGEINLSIVDLHNLTFAVCFSE